MDDILINKENIEAYVSESAYLKYLGDLNDDGIDEIYLVNYRRCGSGGCNYEIYQINVLEKNWT